MNFIQHPSYLEQVHHIELILSKLTIENINKLLQRFDFQCISFEQLQTSGRISLIFNLKVQSKTSSSSIEFILKISNPHCYWKESRTKNEVYTMQYLSEHSTVPIPKIIDYSIDNQTSILSCEYILMEKIYGNTLESVIDKLSHQILLNTSIEIIDYIKQLRQIKLLQMNKIGSFCNKQMLLGQTIEDGPSLGPFNTVKQYIIQHLHWAIQRIQTDKQLFQYGEHLILSIQKIIHHAQTDSNLINFEMKFHVTHTDLNSSNILIDENTGQILAILDWERCAMTFNNDDIEFYSRWFDDNQRELEFKLILQQQKNYLDLNNDISNLNYIQRFLDVMYPAMYATFYSCTWFQCEQTVTEHTQQFLQETENAITAFNNKNLEETK